MKMMTFSCIVLEQSSLFNAFIQTNRSYVVTPQLTQEGAECSGECVSVVTYLCQSWLGP